MIKVIFFLLMCPIFLFGAIEYQCIPIETSGDRIEHIIDFNDEGLVLGEKVRKDDLPLFYFLWDEKTGLIDLKKNIKGLNEAISLNQKGSLTGTVEVSGTDYIFVWKEGRLKILKNHPRLENIRPIHVNESDEVFFFGQDDHNQLKYYCWKSDQVVLLKTLKNSELIVGCNDLGHLLVFHLNNGQFSLVTEYKKQLFSDSRFFLLPVKITQKGDIVGMRIGKKLEKMNGMIWCSDGKTIEIKREGFNIELSDVNSRRVAVGEMMSQDENAESSSQAILWDPSRGLLLLNHLIESSIELTSALKINERGQILAMGKDANHSDVIFLLNPMKSR